MLTCEAVKDLEIGDAVQALPLFKGLTDEPLFFDVVEVVSEEEVTTAKMNVTWFGVHIGKSVVSADPTNPNAGKQVEWSHDFG